MASSVSVRVVKNFIKQNKDNMGRTAKKVVKDKYRPEEKNKESKPEKITNNTRLAPTTMHLKAEEPKSVKFAALSPKLFRKTTIASDIFQKEIKIPKLDQRRPSMRFDPAYNRKLPVYLDIPDLYTRSNRSGKDPNSFYQGVVKIEDSEGGKSSYFFVPRPKTPRKYQPQSSSSNRYVRVENRRYAYRPRPPTPKNYKPRPKSGKRYTKKYTYPATKKTVFKFVGRYKYEPRPPTPKNFLPRPKSSNRYVCDRGYPGGNFKKVGSYVYKPKEQDANNFNPRPKSGNRYKKRYTYPGTRKTIFKFIGRYSYDQKQSNTEKTNSGGNRYVYSTKKRYMYEPRPNSVKNYNPRPKSGIRYAKRYTYPANKKINTKFIGRYKYTPRPNTPKNYLPRPKSTNRYACRTQGNSESKRGQSTFQRRSIFKPSWRYVCKEVMRKKSCKIQTETSEIEEAEHLESNEKVKKVVTIITETQNPEIDPEPDTKNDEIIKIRDTQEQIDAKEPEQQTGNNEKIEEDHVEQLNEDDKTQIVKDGSEEMIENKSKEEIKETLAATNERVMSEEIKNENDNVKQQKYNKVKKEEAAADLKTEINKREVEKGKEKESSKPEKKSEEKKLEIGCWGDEEIRKRIHITKKGWELRGVG